MNHQLFTRWGRELDPENVLSEYPRPQFMRENYTNLNGYWDHCFTRSGRKPDAWEGRILVPFSPESVLSGVGRQLQPDERLWLRRRFEIGPEITDSCYLLHFGAVDQSCAVYVNGRKAAEHIGGYTPFSCDISSLVRKGENILTVCVVDKSDTSWHARGKQKLERGGMYYTATSGIWQSVWMERVPHLHIKEMDCRPLPDEQAAVFRVRTSAGADNDARPDTGMYSGSAEVKITVFEPGIYAENEFPASEAFKENALPVLQTVNAQAGSEIRVTISEPKMWSPESPWLYYVLAECGKDRVLSYFGMRTVTVEKDESTGIPCMMLNHEKVFMRGVLDQGYWSDGLMTAPSDDALIFDIAEMKKTGFNMARKHAKVEAERWYYHCDRMGLFVWQDMVNGGTSYNDWYVTWAATVLNSMRIPAQDNSRRLLSRQDEEGRLEFEHDCEETIRALKAHPCIVVWVLFNEGWGQFDTVRLTGRLKELDPTRLVDSASGWFDQKCGDFLSIHHYFGPFPWRKDRERAAVISEFGGYVLRVPDHFSSDRIYGYKTFESREELEEGVCKLIEKREKYREKGLCAWVYTQWSDIEDEENGIFTYDREVRKIDCI